MEYEFKLCMQGDSKLELPEDVTDQLDRIEKMVAVIFESDLVKVNNKNSYDRKKYDFGYKFYN